jgi:hypothetical protein
MNPNRYIQNENSPRFTSSLGRMEERKDVRKPEKHECGGVRKFDSEGQ